MKFDTSYVTSLLNQDHRLDGRKPDEYREIKIETGVSKNAEGSARVSIGDTVVIAGVKLDVGTPFPDNPDEGSIIVGAELNPMASPEFELGPPNAQSIELARVVDRGIRESKAIDFKKLCITEGEKVWIVFIDIYAFNDDGNLQDAASLAALAALKDAKFPKLKDNKVVYGELTDKKLPLVREPVECTLGKINGKIIVDPNTKEEKALNARLTVAVTKEGTVCAIQKGGDYGLSIEEVDAMIDLAIRKTKDLRKLL
ncbi:exosome complex protein Rrp42 [Candidatus Woesearchaeota archaeon]|nr:exosome complex protein Rrp42 [Candidatus Woesearchaeota archaeon]